MSTHHGAKLRPYYEDSDDDDDDDPFRSHEGAARDSTSSGLPDRLDMAVPANGATRAAALEDELGYAMDRAEERGLASASESGLRTAMHLRKARTAQPPVATAEARISELPPYAPVMARDAEDVEFFARIQRLQRAGTSDDAIAARIPNMMDTLAYVAKCKSATHGLWLEASQHHLIENGIAEWERVPVCTREYLADFWREPSPGRPWERPCKRLECESERLGGFRCRELIYPEEWARVRASKGQWLPQHVGWCVMCHLAVTNELYLTAKNKLHEKFPENERIQHQIHRIHHFCVPVDIVGEYRMSQTLCGDSNVMGLFGFFPIYNVQNYVQCKLGPRQIRGWRESDALVFQEAQATLDRNESCPTTLGGQANSSNPSAPIGSRQPVTGFRP